MIIKIDHVAFASDCLDEALRSFSHIGYEARFVEKGLRDLENKRPFLEHFSGELDMALMTRLGSVNIELLDHGHSTAGDSYVLPIFEGGALEADKMDDRIVLNGRSVVRARSRMLNAELFLSEDVTDAAVRCNKLVVESNDMKHSVEFWRNFGFRRCSANDQFVSLEFAAPFQGEAYQLLVRGKKRGEKKYSLDSQGFNCIALFTTKVEKEREKLIAWGAETTDINLFKVNGKDLSIFWVRGPSDEVVEVIGLT